MMSKKNYVFNTKIEAEAALNEINSDAVFPITNYNAKTGLPAPDKQKTERWSEKPKQRKDGKYFFPRLPKPWRDKQPKEKSDKFKEKHKFTIEEYDSNWVDQIEEI